MNHKGEERKLINMPGFPGRFLFLFKGGGLIEELVVEF